MFLLRVFLVTTLLSRPYCNHTLFSLPFLLLFKSKVIFLCNSFYMYLSCSYIFLLYIPVWLLQWPCFQQHKKYQNKQCVQTPLLYSNMCMALCCLCGAFWDRLCQQRAVSFVYRAFCVWIASFFSLCHETDTFADIQQLHIVTDVVNHGQETKRGQQGNQSRGKKFE